MCKISTKVPFLMGQGWYFKLQCKDEYRKYIFLNRESYMPLTQSLILLTILWLVEPV